MISGIIGGVLVVMAWQLWKYYHESEVSADENVSTEETSADANGQSVRDIVLRSLTDLQCNPSIDEDGDSVSISFEFQAENFTLLIENKCRFVTLYDASWYSFESDDVNQLSNVKRIINEINWSSAINVCYTKDDEDNRFLVHTKASLLCVEAGDFTDYLRHILRECFVVHNNFYKMLAAA